MSVPALVAALLVGGTPTIPCDMTTAVALSLTQQGAGSQEVGQPAAPVIVLEPPLAVTAAEPSSQPEPASGTDQNEIVVTAQQHAPPGDPLEKINAKFFAATQAVDKAVVGPIALAYKHTVPGPARHGLRNFLYNLHEPVVFLNFLLQLKPGKAAQTLGRFAINSTIGGAGLFDVAKRRPFNLPRRPNGFADSLGYWGVKPGPFLYLPLIGPTTVRDLVGTVLDRLVLPLPIGKPFNRLTYTVPTGVLSSLDRRVEFDDQLHRLRDESADPYTASKKFYLEGRQTEIDELRGKRSSACPMSEVAGPTCDTLPLPTMITTSSTDLQKLIANPVICVDTWRVVPVPASNANRNSTCDLVYIPGMGEPPLTLPEQRE